MSSTSDSNIPTFQDAMSAPIPGKLIVERRTVNVVLVDMRSSLIGVLDWEKFDWRTFIIGGIEGKETNAEAALREIREESGYSDVRVVNDNLGQFRSIFYAAHKDENRVANTVGVLCELVSNNRFSTEAHLPHVFRWLPLNQVPTFINLSSQKHLWSLAVPHLPKGD